MLATTTVTAKDSSPTKALLFLHGLLGTRANWRGLARKFVDARPDWAAVLVDLREHGDSLGLPGPDTVEQCALDLASVAAPEGTTIRGALGHSFGGKVAMRWAELHPESAGELVIVDSSPSARGAGAGEATRVLDLLRTGSALHPNGYDSREAFTDYVVASGESRGIADWLAMNLAVLPSGRRGLRLDLDRIECLLADYGRTDTWGAVETSPIAGTVRFLLGGKSGVVDESDRHRLDQALKRGRPVRVDSVPDAGHWVHVDAPERVSEVLANLY